MKGMINYRCPGCGKLKLWPPMLRSIPRCEECEVFMQKAEIAA